MGKLCVGTAGCLVQLSFWWDSSSQLGSVDAVQLWVLEQSFGSTVHWRLLFAAGWWLSNGNQYLTILKALNCYLLLCKSVTWWGTDGWTFRSEDDNPVWLGNVRHCCVPWWWGKREPEQWLQLEVGVLPLLSGMGRSRPPAETHQWGQAMMESIHSPKGHLYSLHHSIWVTFNRKSVFFVFNTLSSLICWKEMIVTSLNAL